MDVFTLKNLLMQRMKTHDEVQWNLMMIGNQLGYNAVQEYEVFNLVPNRPRSKIDVVWLSGDKIAVAFEVRRKTRDLDIPTSEKDRDKLARLNADEKFLVNFSKLTGAVYIFKMDNNGEWL